MGKSSKNPSSSYISPSFFIIGERKCGTSSLYRYLVAHPNVLPCALKEPNFFGKGMPYVRTHIDEYWSLFPEKTSKEDIHFRWPELNHNGMLYHEDVVVKRIENQNYITGEASANTFFEVSPDLVKHYLPEIKLIILLRNPVDRAFSHHRMYQRFQAEGRNLGFVVNDFETDILTELDLFQKGEEGHYLAPSIYIHRLIHWAKVFSNNQLKILFLEELSEQSAAMSIMEELQVYLKLPFFDYNKIISRRYNVAPPIEMKSALRANLSSFFKPFNQELSNFLDRELPKSWD